jgi:hypothetical protein
MKIGTWWSKQIEYVLDGPQSLSEPCVTILQNLLSNIFKKVQIEMYAQYGVHISP